MDATFNCNVSGPTSSLPHLREHTGGSGHAPTGAQGRLAAALAGVAMMRLGLPTCSLSWAFCGTMWGPSFARRDQLLYSFFNTDQICRLPPFHRHEAICRTELHAQCTLAPADKTVFHYRGNVTPPKDYRPMGYVDPQAGRGLGRALRFERSQDSGSSKCGTNQT